VLLAGFPVVILDEPAEHLDEPTAAALTADLLEATAGRTVLLITHRPVSGGGPGGYVGAGSPPASGGLRGVAPPGRHSVDQVLRLTQGRLEPVPRRLADPFGAIDPKRAARRSCAAPRWW